MDPVQGQLDAFNNRDLERFLSCYAPDAVIEDADGNVTMRGHEDMRPVYAALFESSPKLHAEVVQRIRSGAFVIDEEHATGITAEGFPPEMRLAVIYRVKDDLIQQVRMLL